MAVRRRRLRRKSLSTLGVLGLCLLVSYSAVLTKELSVRSAGVAALTSIDQTDPDLVADSELPVDLAALAEDLAPDPLAEPMDAGAVPMAEELVAGEHGAIDEPAGPSLIEDTSIRFFNGRAVRPARTIWMLVTAYSPDAASCGDSADGITASLHNVTTNAHRLVAADTKILPLGSMISIPGYDSGFIVPVLDRGGAIKGHRLDVLFPTHAQARAWGVKKLRVTVWEYADGLGAENWRAIRDSKQP